MNKNNSFFSEITAGSIAGASSRTIVAPFERIKIILQT
jgi:hypothetical protein